MLRNRYVTGGGSSVELDAELVAFLETGCAWIVGTVSGGGEPYASRAWGATVLGRGPELRLVLDAHDTVTIDRFGARGQVAATATSVRTFRSTQLKGYGLGIEPATPADRARAARYCDEFFTDIVETDGFDRRLLEQWAPVEYVVGLLHAVEVFDQTPGPGAGARLEGRT